jgi:RNA polymerase sigma factor (sigma-70 family)
MDLEGVFRKQGGDWSEQEIIAVHEWIEQQLLDDLVRFAYGFLRAEHDGLERAKDVVMTKIADALLRHRHTYDSTRYHGRGNPFKNWLYMMVARATCRLAKRRRRQVDAEHRRVQEERRLQTPSHVLELDWGDLWDELQPYVARLRPIYHQALQLYYAEHLSVAEAAVRAGCLPGTFKVRLCRARQELRRLLHGHLLREREVV